MLAGRKASKPGLAGGSADWRQQAIVLLSSLEAPSIGPQEMGLLVSGALLVLCWHYLAFQVSSFDVRGLGSLLQMWLVAVAALALGQVVRILTPPLDADADADDALWHPAALAAAAAKAAAGGSGSGGGLPEKEGREPYVLEPCSVRSGPAEAAQEDEEDMAVIKRRAQAEAAAKLARYRADVQQLLAAISAGADPEPLFKLAEQLFASPINLSEFVMLGGLPVVVAAMERVTRDLGKQQQQQQQALKALLQASWVVLQLAHGPPACRAALDEPHTVCVLLSAAQAVGQLPPGAAPSTDSILRNLWWTLLILCDSPNAAGSRGPPSAHAAHLAHKQLVLQQLAQPAVVSHLQQLVALRHGPSAAWVAAAQLALLVHWGHEAKQQQRQQQQQRQPDDGAAGPADAASLSTLSAAAVQAMLQPESLAGLGFLLQHNAAQQGPQLEQKQLSGRLRGLVEGLLHYLLTFHAPELLQLLVEGRLVGCYAAHSCLKLGRLLVCQLLSSTGQAVLAAVEAGYELDVPLALAQVVPLKLHIKLPRPRQQQRQQQGLGEIEPADVAEAEQQQLQQLQACREAGQDAAAGAARQHLQQLSVQAAMAADTYTDVMACGLLLQHDRLHELLAAYCEEIQAAQQQQQQQQQAAASSSRATVPAGEQAAAEQPAAASEAVLALVQHLMTRDLQLHSVQHVRGDSVAASVSSGSSSSSSIDAALAMPDAAGLYSRVMAGMVPDDDLPASPTSSGSGASSSDALYTLPPLPAEQQQQQELDQGAQQRGGGQRVTFQFGQLRHTVEPATYRAMKASSSLVRSLLRQAGGGGGPSGGGAVTVLCVPRFTDAANRWVVRCLERWLAARSLAGFTPLQAAQLWVAADFLQVNDLQAACEDVMLAACAADAAFVPTAVELCGRHPEPNARLLRLLARQLLRDCAAGSAGALQELLARHQGLLLPVVHDELRDRLLTMCIQNSNLDADCPDEAVG